ncbi:nucleoporin Nup43 isoform X2 [Periplaneta americana]|uniref:nucleoporin Nup43 isoform X2 n=1 Tax=Periplaneta americana TaxID=6978 RepID=UPI0037E71206
MSSCWQHCVKCVNKFLIMEEKVLGTFVGEKISKVRWKPEDLIESNTFLTGSWDNEFINNNTFVVSSSTGSVKLFKIEGKGSRSSEFKEFNSWNSIHYFSFERSSPCTGLACFEEDIATVGEDGRLVLLTARQKRPVRRIEKADSCSLHCVCFLKHNEVLTGNLRGQMKVWDLKNPADKPATTFMLSGEQVAASCVTHHPTQCHMVLAGGEDGSLTVWDLRRNTFPVTLLSAHSDTVSELHFHPDRPEHLFTCSMSGEVWHWNTSSMSRPARLGTTLPEFSGDENPWLNSDAAKHRLEVFTLMPQLHKPVNSLDVNKNRVVCGCDNEAVYVLKNIVL